MRFARRTDPEDAGGAGGGMGQNEAATLVRGGEFLVRANNDLFQASKGNSD